MSDVMRKWGEACARLATAKADEQSAFGAVVRERDALLAPAAPVETFSPGNPAKGYGEPVNCAAPVAPLAAGLPVETSVTPPASGASKPSPAGDEAKEREAAHAARELWLNDDGPYGSEPVGFIAGYLAGLRAGRAT